MEFRILGPLEVYSDGQAIEVGGAKQRALLAVLLLHANQVVSRDRLVDALWPSDPPASAQKALQMYVSGLRKLLGKERLETRAPGYLLRVADDELDLERFRQLREQGMPAEALALWRGPPLSEFAYEGFAQALGAVPTLVYPIGSPLAPPRGARILGRRARSTAPRATGALRGPS